MKFKNISRVRIWLISGVLICGLISLSAYFFSDRNEGLEEEIQKNFLSYETKAEKLGIQIITEQEFDAMIKPSE